MPSPVPFAPRPPAFVSLRRHVKSVQRPWQSQNCHAPETATMPTRHNIPCRRLQQHSVVHMPLRCFTSKQAHSITTTKHTWMPRSLRTQQLASGFTPTRHETTRLTKVPAPGGTPEKTYLTRARNTEWRTRCVNMQLWSGACGVCVGGWVGGSFDVKYELYLHCVGLFGHVLTRFLK